MKLGLISGTDMASGLWLFDESTPWRNSRGGSDYVVTGVRFPKFAMHYYVMRVAPTFGVHQRWEKPLDMP